ncbi:GNAT family N-acetyltransferase [Magnetospira thiophila]
MDISDYDAVFQLFSETPGVSVREADSRDSTLRYLARNPGLSFVAVSEKKIVGCIFCGHDGRRGYLQHLVVDPVFRNQGIARRLVARCIDTLQKLEIKKSHVDVLVTNSDAQTFWSNLGWQKRQDIYRFSFINSEDPDT